MMHARCRSGHQARVPPGNAHIELLAPGDIWFARGLEITNNFVSVTGSAYAGMSSSAFLHDDQADDSKTATQLLLSCTSFL